MQNNYGGKARVANESPKLQDRVRSLVPPLAKVTTKLSVVTPYPRDAEAEEDSTWKIPLNGRQPGLNPGAG